MRKPSTCSRTDSSRGLGARMRRCAVIELVAHRPARQQPDRLAAEFTHRENFSLAPVDSGTARLQGPRENIADCHLAGKVLEGE